MASNIVLLTGDQLRQISDFSDEAWELGYLLDGEGPRERQIPLWDARTPGPHRDNFPGMEDDLWTDLLMEARVKRFLILKNVAKSRNGRATSPTPETSSGPRTGEREREKGGGGGAGGGEELQFGSATPIQRTGGSTVCSAVQCNAVQ